MVSGIDWQALFVPSLHLGEVVLRGTLVYLFLFFLMRIFRREAGDIGISDLLVVVLREKIQEAELLAQLRVKGVDGVEDVKQCYLEETAASA